MHRFGIVAALTFWSFAAPAFGDGYIVGITLGFVPGTAPLVRIDPNTGIYTTLSNSSNSYNALAQDSLGNIYGGWFSSSEENGRITRIALPSGAALQNYLASTPGAGSIRGLAFDAADTLFAVVNRDDSSGSPTINDDFYQINLTTQTTSLIGTLGFKAVQALDVSPTGQFYAWDVEVGLLSVNPLTGAATDVNPTIGGIGGIQSIVFAPDGRLFGAREQLYSINPTTGAFALIGPGGGPDVRGIEWIVPEGHSALQMLIGGLLIGWGLSQRRQRRDAR